MAVASEGVMMVWRRREEKGEVFASRGRLVVVVVAVVAQQPTPYLSGTTLQYRPME